MGADAGEFGEGEVAGFGEFADADGAAARVERDGDGLAVDGDGAVFDVGALLDATFRTPRCLGGGFGGGDPVDREQPEVAQQSLVMHAAQGGVVDDTLRAVDEWCEAGEAGHGGAGFGAGGGDPFDVEDDPAVHVGGARGDEDELGSPGHLAVSLDMEATVGIGAQHAELTGLGVEVGVAGPRPKQGSDDFAVGVQHPRQIGMRP